MFSLKSTGPKILSGPKYAIAWSHGDQNYEILNSRTGQTEFGISKFSKNFFLNQYTSIIKNFVLFSDDYTEKLYSDLKLSAIDYQVINLKIINDIQLHKKF